MDKWLIDKVRNVKSQSQFASAHVWRAQTWKV